MQQLPLRSIPAFLCPRSGIGRQPPVMRLGYPMPYSWVESFAEDRDLLALENHPEYGIIGAIHMVGTVANIINYINDKAGLTTYKVTEASVYRIKCIREMKEPYVFISVASNYLGRRPGVFPSGDEVEKLKVFLGVDDGPKWYLDAKEFLWADRELCLR